MSSEQHDQQSGGVPPTSNGAAPWADPAAEEPTPALDIDAPQPVPDGRMRRVIAWLEVDRAYGRQCVLGIAAYARAQSNWRVFHFDHKINDEVPETFHEVDCDGILARTDRQEVMDELHRIGKPIVDLRAATKNHAGESLTTDAAACSEMAWDHFWNRGFRRLAFCGFPQAEWSRERREIFKQMGRERGIDVHVFQPGGHLDLQRVVKHEALGVSDDPQLTDWLRSLPKPIGVFAANDVRGWQVISACKAAEISVPEQVAVLGVDNDEVVCELSNPQLSSIEPDARRLGYEGARTLDAWMENAPGCVPGRVQSLRPLKVVTRASSDIAALDDDLVADAIRLIRERGGTISSVQMLAREFDVSRTTLERRFRTALGRSPRQEIDRVRLDRARLMVLESTMPLHKIAHEVGYSNASRLLNAYRRHFGITPGEHRRETTPGANQPFR